MLVTTSDLAFLPHAVRNGYRATEVECDIRFDWSKARARAWMTWRDVARDGSTIRSASGWEDLPGKRRQLGRDLAVFLQEIGRAARPCVKPALFTLTLIASVGIA